MQVQSRITGSVIMPDSDIYFVCAVANLGAIALQNARLLEFLQKNYKAFKQEMQEWRAALGHEWMMAEAVAPSQD